MKTFRALSLPYLKDVYQLVDKICSQNGVEFYLIGAQARDIHLLEKEIQPTRGTMDIDFAIMLPDLPTFDKIKNELVEVGFEKVKMPYRMIHRPTNTVIDLLPFGQIEQGSTVKFTEREIELSVIGFNEVNESVENIEIEGVSLRVTPMAGIFLLKLISWNEKPKVRLKDHNDIKFILKNYFELYGDRFYSDNLDCIEEIPTDHFELSAGARLLGRDMNPIVARSEKLKTLIIQIIDDRLAGTIGDLSRHSNEDFDGLDKLDKQLLVQIKKGINETK